MKTFPYALLFAGLLAGALVVSGQVTGQPAAKDNREEEIRRRQPLCVDKPNLRRYALGDTPVCRWKSWRKNATS